jgi:peroxiredoxin
MWKKIIPSLFLFLLIAVAIVQAMSSNSEQQSSGENLGGLKVGEKAPDFTLQTLDGQTVTLSDLQGKKVLLNFWATWCPPCKKEMPDMQKYYAESGDDIVILAVNIDPENDVQAFINEMQLTFPILLDSQSAKKPISDVYAVISIPTSYFIDSTGVIQSKHIGPMEEAYMREQMNDL